MYFNPDPTPQPAILRLNWLAAGLIILLGSLIPLFVFGADDLIVDDFEAYDLGNLTGQGDWVELPGGYDPLQVNTDDAQSGSKSIKGTSDWTGNIRTESGVANGIQSFWFYILPPPNHGLAFGFWENTTRKFYLSGLAGADVRIMLDGSKEICEVIAEEWINLQIEWDAPTNKVRFNCDLAGWGEWENVTSFDYIEKFSIAFAKESFVDNLTGEYIPQMEIVGISPGTGTEITDFETNLTIEYRNFDWEIYSGFIVNFKDDKIDSLANSVLFEVDDDELDPSGTGQKTISLNTFGIDTNGKWNLTGLGFGTKLDIEGGMYLTTRGYIDFWTNELVKEPYYLIINVSGLPEFYTFTDAPDWYSTNVDRFVTPTVFFTSVVGLMSPLFEKISEFGRRTLMLFDTNESYDRGFALGEIFPLINGYIEKIDLFFGGFPLGSFFKYLILLMFAGFIIRTILKFIPLFG